MDMNQYLEIFLDESQEHLQAINENLLILEKQPRDQAIINEIFRSAHTLKGMSATMGFEDIASLTHQMENVLELIRKEELSATTEVIDTGFQVSAALEDMVSDIQAGGKGKKDVVQLIALLERLMGKDHEPSKEMTNKEREPLIFDEYESSVILQAFEQGNHIYQFDVQIREDCQLKSVRAYMVFETLKNMGEVIKTVPSMEELEKEQFGLHFSIVYITKEDAAEIQEEILHISEIEFVNYSIVNPANPENLDKAQTSEQSQSSEHAPKHAHSKTIRVNIERIDRLMNLFEEMVIDRGRLEDISETIGNHALDEAVENLSRLSLDMQNMMLSLRMVPIEQVFNRFPRMVRGIAKDLKKKIDLKIIGAETELDRTVIDEIGDPLVHLIRNSLDHGIELPSIRKGQGKSEEGSIVLRAFHSGNHVIIEIEDDGAGINREKVVKKAVKKGLITANEADTLSDEEVYHLIFSSGFSTAEQVSDISGRGVGLDVVKSKIETLGGQVFVESQSGKGSKFSIQLPLTLSILSTLLVKVQNETYAIPLSSIEETVSLKKEDILQAHQRNVMDFRNKIIPLVSLDDVFSLGKSSNKTKEQEAIVVVKKRDQLTGLVVDSFLGQKEVVLKSLGDYLGDVYAVSGATILGDGSVSLIIDPNELIK
jgi:two-component system, chemotaxis family, sensor kinase CheA